MSKSSSKKRIIIAASLFAIFLIGAIVSVVMVLAATTQNVQTNISIAYIVDGVGAKVKSSYAVVPISESETISRVSMTSNGNEDLNFGVSEQEKTGEMQPATGLYLDTEHQQIVFEYYFESTSDAAFSIELINSPGKNSGTNISEQTSNMLETFCVSRERLKVSEYRSKITEEELKPQALTEIGQYVYIYVSAKVKNENLNAYYNGMFTWELNKQDTITVTLNNGDTTRELKVIPSSVVAGIAMPPVAPPETTLSQMFMGWNTAADGSGITYINREGKTPEGIVANIAAGTTLYAQIIDAFVVNESGVLTGLTTEGQAEEVLYIPEGITSIGDGTNAVSTTAKTVVVPSSVTEIAANAFSGNTTIEYVNFENSVQTAAYADGSGFVFGEKAFYNCTALKEINIPSNIEEIANNAFNGCSSLTLINILSIESWLSLDFGEWGDYYPFFEYNYDSINFSINGKFATNVVIPNTITSISSFAFSGWKNLESVWFEDESSVESIGNVAFGYCRNLKSIEIPRSLKTIGIDVFESCSLMKKLYIEDLESYLKLDFDNYGGENNSSHPFQCSYENKEIYINGKLTTEIIIPESITVLNKDIFYNCSNIISISISDSITSIGDNAFSGCSSLKYNEYKDIKYLGNEENPYLVLIDVNDDTQSSYEIHENTKVIYEMAFYGCSSLTSITIPSSVTNIGEFAFAYCNSLTSVTIVSTSGWKMYDSRSSSETGYAINVSTAGTNAENLKNTRFSSISATATNWGNFYLKRSDS